MQFRSETKILFARSDLQKQKTHKINCVISAIQVYSRLLLIRLCIFETLFWAFFRKKSKFTCTKRKGIQI